MVTLREKMVCLDSAVSLRLPAEIVNYEFDTKNLICLVISSLVGVWYLLKKVRLTVIRPPSSPTAACEAHPPQFINELLPRS